MTDTTPVPSIADEDLIGDIAAKHGNAAEAPFANLTGENAIGQVLPRTSLDYDTATGKSFANSSGYSHRARISHRGNSMYWYMSRKPTIFCLAGEARMSCPRCGREQPRRAGR